MSTILKCKICGSGDGVRNCFDGDDRVLRCQKCGNGFLNDKLIQPGREYYEEAPNYGSIINDSGRLELIKGNAVDQLSFITRYLEPSGRTLLDVGAHTGTFVHEASRYGFRSEGIEPNKVAADWAAGHGISVSHGDLESYQPSKKYDVITMFHVLEHLSNPITGLSKLKDWLSGGGYLVLEVPNSESYLAKIDEESWKYIALEHFFYFSESSLKNILNNVGFEVVASKKRNFEINYLNPRKLMHYFLGNKIIRDRFKTKGSHDHVSYLGPSGNFIKKSVTKFMAKLIHVLGREDHILIIAKKND